MMMLCQKTLNKIMMIKLMKMKWMNKNKYLNKMILRTKINKFLNILNSKNKKKS